MLFLPREKGQGLVEYALILVLVAIVVTLLVTVLAVAYAALVRKTAGSAA